MKETLFGQNYYFMKHVSICHIKIQWNLFKLNTKSQKELKRNYLLFMGISVTKDEGKVIPIYYISLLWRAHNNLIIPFWFTTLASCILCPNGTNGGGPPSVTPLNLDCLDSIYKKEKNNWNTKFPAIVH